MPVLSIGENLNIMGTITGKAMKERNKKVVQEMAIEQKEAGIDYIDLNIGPAGKIGKELMPWVVETVQEVVDLPCALDSSNVDAIHEGLKVHKGRALINSIMARPERMEALLPLAKEFDADFVGLLWGPDGMPRDEDERAMLCMEITTNAAAIGIPNERIWIDPIITPVSVQQNQLISGLNFMMMLQDIAPGVQATCGLSNISNGAPNHLRPILNQTHLMFLKRYGMTSAIVDYLDTVLLEICKDQHSDWEEVVYKIQDGEDVDMSSLTPDQLTYVKTAKVIMGQVLYSDSWLD